MEEEEGERGNSGVCLNLARTATSPPVGHVRVMWVRGVVAQGPR